jgi:hypothetical protein
LIVHIPCRNTREGNTASATSLLSPADRLGEILGARHLSEVEFQVAGHPVEDFSCARRSIHADKVQLDAVGPHVAGVEIQHAVVQAAGHGELQGLGHLGILAVGTSDYGCTV